MARKSIYRVLLIVSLVTFIMGCNLVSNIIKGAESVSTGVAVFTEVEGIVTEINIGSMVTEINIGSMVTDMGSMVTEMGSIVTEMDIESMVTEINLDSMVTEMNVDSLVTEIGGGSGNAPQDIPVMEGEKMDFTSSQTEVIYMIDQNLATVLQFYQREMPAKGWIVAQSGTPAGEGETVLVYQKDNRKATVTLSEIPFLNQTSVSITIQ